MQSVVSIEDIIAQAQPKKQVLSATEAMSLPGQVSNKRKENKTSSRPENLVPRGQPKSGRFWKTPKTKASKLIATRGLRLASTFEKKEKLRAELKAAKELTRTRLEERKRKQIRNPAKIKRMRKKQLRSIEKRDTTNM
ncbi:hypothetical protein B566_EDAN003040 [Ephemera danica]|nr:hypothetical protein B566_EDAN003040 [Ephemera danica]